MARHYLRLCARSVRATALACAASVFLVFGAAGPTPAHEGHDHAAEAPPAVGASPRVVATSETYQFVGIAEGEVLVIYLDRAEDNTPVTSATIDVSLNGEAFKAELQEKSATYEVTAPLLRKSGSYEVLVTLSDGGRHDLLVGTLRIPASGQANNRLTGIRQVVANRLASSSGRSLLVAAGVLLLVGAVVGGAVLPGRRKLYLLPAAMVGLVLASVGAWAHEGHDHGPDLSVSTGNSPSRRPDGSLFIPKPTQRLLEIRTRTLAIENRTRTVRFNGRIVANPNRSGVVQSTLQGRYEAPEGGVPPLGTHVKAGDMLGRVSPAFQSIDSSDMAQTLGTLDQDIALNRRKLARQEHLLTTNAVAKATVEDTRIQIEGLEKRRRELLAAKLRPEDLRAPVDGVIAATRVVAGQVVGPADQLFQIIDPGSLLVEALVFDQTNPDTVDEATAVIGTGAAIKLKFLGRSRALQQQYSIVQFKIVDTAVALNVGAPVTVVASNGEPITGIVLPRAALVQAPNGQTVVFSHKEPEVFVPRPVRFENFDGENILITAGIGAGEKVVVRNAPLLNQVR
jgi:membrane fusion protein, heavy metal efflux system